MVQTVTSWCRSLRYGCPTTFMADLSQKQYVNMHQRFTPLYTHYDFLLYRIKWDRLSLTGYMNPNDGISFVPSILWVLSLAYEMNKETFGPLKLNAIQLIVFWSYIERTVVKSTCHPMETSNASGQFGQYRGGSRLYAWSGAHVAITELYLAEPCGV